MAVLPGEAETGTQTDNHPLLMDHSENVGHCEHAIDMPRDDVASSSTSRRDNCDGSGQLANVSESSSGTTTASNSRNASFTRRRDNHGRSHRSPLNSGLWISIEVVVNVGQIIAAVSVLSISRNEHPHAPLFEWIIGYTAGCIVSLPHLYWRYFHHNRLSTEQEPASQNSPLNNTPETNSYTVISAPRVPEVEDETDTSGVSRNNVATEHLRVHALVDHFKMVLDCFFAVWFVVGNIWIFAGRSSAHDAPNLYSCIGYAMPFILCAMLCCCLPCIISIMGFREDLSQNRGATAEVINALLTYKFKSKRVHNGEGSEDGGGVLAAGTNKERIISAEDAVCSICLARYADNDDLRELPCTHFFHKECVDKWLKINALCPLCKAEIGGGGSTSAPAIGFGRRHNDNRVGDDVESQQQ